MTKRASRVATITVAIAMMGYFKGGEKKKETAK